MIRGLIATLAATAAATVPTTAITNEQDITNQAGYQAEVAVALDPTDPRILLGASNDLTGIRTYTSVDGGATWRARLDLPNTLLGDTPAADPIPQIDSNGREYVSFIAAASPFYVGLARRDGPNGEWTITHQPLVDHHIQDKPMLAVDAAPESPHPGRLYVGFVDALRVRSAHVSLVITHSDDRGETWSPPVTLSSGRQTTQPQFLTIAVGRHGVVYVAWFTYDGKLWIARSSDGDTFSAPQVAARVSGTSGWFPRAQPQRGVTATPLLAVDTSGGPYDGRVYLAFDDRRDGRVNAYVASFSPDFGVAVSRRPFVREPRQPADRFLPAIAVDESNGDVWACFYATDGDRTRRQARYSCAISHDGGTTWSPPLRAASKYSDARESNVGGDFNFGDYEGLAAGGGAAHPMSTDARASKRERKQEIWTATLRASTP